MAKGKLLIRQSKLDLSGEAEVLYQIRCIICGHRVTAVTPEVTSKAAWGAGYRYCENIPSVDGNSTINPGVLCSECIDGLK
jgi:hypothetical protein